MYVIIITHKYIIYQIIIRDYNYRDITYKIITFADYDYFSVHQEILSLDGTAEEIDGRYKWYAF